MDVINYATIIPPEIWTKIFELLDIVQPDYNRNFNTNDILNCYHSCITFHNILKSTIISTLFSQVLPYIHPYITKHSIKPILNCRLVCKAWKQGMDHFLENHDIFNQKQLQNGKASTNYFMSSLPNKSLPMTCLFTEQEITLFYTERNFEETSPFLGNSLLLRCSPFDDQTGAIYMSSPSLQELLIQFGRFVKVLYLFIFQYECPYQVNGYSPYIRLYEQIRNILDNTPNLRKLSIKGYLNISRIKWFDQANSSVDWEVETFNLSSLESVEIDIGGRHLLGIKLAMHLPITSSSFLQLKRLCLSNMLKDDYIGIKSIKQMWSRSSGCLPNLEQLEVRIVAITSLLEIFHLISTSTKLRCLVIKIAAYLWKDDAKFFSKYYPYNDEPVYRSFYEWEYEKEMPYYHISKHQLVLGDLLRTVETLVGKWLETLVIFVEDIVRIYCKTNEHDLEILKEMPRLWNLHIEGFPLSKLEMVGKLPSTLMSLVLSGFLNTFHFDLSFESNKLKKLPGVCLDLKDGWSIYQSELWERLPSVRCMRVVLWNYKKKERKVYIYRREKRDWIMTRTVGQLEHGNFKIKKATHEENNSCCLVI